jgi:hypothetical protein
MDIKQPRPVKAVVQIGIGKLVANSPENQAKDYRRC